MKILKYTILALIVLNLPTAMLFWVSEGLGSATSHLVYALLLLYPILRKEGGSTNKIMLLLGISYFIISALDFEYGPIETKYYFFDLIKYIIFIIGGSRLVEDTNKFELVIFLLLGTISIIIHALFYSDNFGRYSGFYMNPNAAGFIAITGYALTYSLNNKFFKTLTQIIFTIGGIITFSRTFIIIWILVNILSIRISIKNVKILAAGAAVFVALITFGEVFKLNTIRLKQFSSILNNEEGAVTEANDDSRTETWALFYEDVLDKPFLGNGYLALSGHGLHNQGAHNSFLMIIGEAGIVPFILLTGIYFYFIFSGFMLFDSAPHILMQAISIFLFLLTFHNYFVTFYVLIFTLWMFHEINIKKKHV